ncbi:MAG: hypothetical protein KGZ51_00780 [Erysipelothrix sp.]|jgi:hypothetical protein|nr:hypothetical protein [Erysipelothrix sp.]
MKKIAMLILLVLLVTSVSACTVYTPNRLPDLGKYTMKDADDPEYAWVLLKEDNKFEFNRHIATSYRPSGSYSVEDDKLTLMVSEEEVYIFLIKGNRLIFESSGSVGAIVEVGTIFELSTGK